MGLNVRDVTFKVVPFWTETHRSGRNAEPSQVMMSGQQTKHDSIKDAEAYAIATLQMLDAKATIQDPQVDVLQEATYKTEGGKHRRRSKTVRQYTPADLHTGLFSR